MDIIDYLITNIAPLSLTVKGIGLLIIAFLLMRTFGQVFSFRWIKAATSLVTVCIVLLVMARFGTDIDHYIDTQYGSAKTDSEQTR